MRRGGWRAGLALVFSWGAATSAADLGDVYVTGGVGGAHAPAGSLGAADADVWFDLGRPVGTLAVGVERGSGWRFELDGSYRFNDVEVVYFDDGTPDLQSDADSRIEAVSLVMNALYDWDLRAGFQPYLGAGLGGARLDYRIAEYYTGAELLNDDDDALVYQLVAGAAVELTRRLDLMVDYRYWHAPDVSLEPASGEGFDTDHRVHSAMVSLRYRPFGGTEQRRSAQRDAKNTRGWYVHARGGMSFAKDAEIEDNIANFDAFEVGPAVAVAVGRTLGSRWRVELEGSQRRHDVEIVDFNPIVGEERADGRVRATSLMANAVYEPRWGRAYQPYVGLGAGVAHGDWNVGLSADDVTYVDDAGDTAAFQVMVGAAADVTDHLTVTAEFRYWITTAFDLAQPDGRRLRTDLTVNTLMLGVRYRMP